MFFQFYYNKPTFNVFLLICGNILDLSFRKTRHSESENKVKQGQKLSIRLRKTV